MRTAIGLVVKMALMSALAGLPALAVEPAAGWIFPAGPVGAVGYETDTQVGIYNGQAGVLFRKSDSMLLGVWSKAGGACAGNDVALVGVRPPVWSLEIMPAGATNPVTVEPAAATQVVWRVTGDARSRTLEAAYDGLACGPSHCRAIMRVSLGADDGRPRWRMDAFLSDSNAGVWSLTFPRLVVPAPDADPKANRLLTPYRRGTLGLFGAGRPQSAVTFPYPGPAAKFQFMAAYGEQKGGGVYYGIEDGAGYSKDFIQQNFPVQNRLVLASRHFPVGRAEPGAGFAMPYDVVAGPYQGDWWDAARLYRAWWTNQVWASKGLLADRADVPEWLKRVPVALRLSTTKPERTVSNNVAGAQAFMSALGIRSAYGVWYGPFGSPSVRGLDSGGHGHLTPALPGVADALALLGGKGLHIQAYLQSIIYDTRHPAYQEPAEHRVAEAAVSRDLQGNPHFYGASSNGLYTMCRASEGWQSRLVVMSESAVRLGFDGIYLDSFGKGSAECFVAGHGHTRGGGNTVLQGQRVMAKRIQGAIQAIRPGASLSGEAPVEAFRDLLEIPLEAVNRYSGYCPVTRAVWGDYGFSYGRTIRTTSTSNNVIPELATLFLEGIVPGRFFCEGGLEILQPAQAANLTFLKKTIRYTEAGLDYVRFGEYLRPLPLPQPVPAVSMREGAENNLIDVPGLLHGVYRSHRDGRVAVVLVNVGAQEAALRVPLAGVGPAAKDAPVARLGVDGKEVPAGRREPDGTLAVTVKAGDIVFLVLR